MADEQNNGGKKSNGMAVASLVCGILSLVSIVFGMFAWVGLILGVLAIIFGAIANKARKDGKATAGLVMGIVGAAVSAIVFISCAVCAYNVNKVGKEVVNSKEWNEVFDSIKDKSDKKKDSKTEELSDELSEALDKAADEIVDSIDEDGLEQDLNEAAQALTDGLTDAAEEIAKGTAKGLKKAFQALGDLDWGLDEDEDAGEE